MQGTEGAKERGCGFAARLRARAGCVVESQTREPAPPTSPPVQFVSCDGALRALGPLDTPCRVM